MHREDRDVQPGVAGLRAAVNRGPASSVEPFTIDVSAEVLADLRQRLERTRWPDVSPRGGWVSGTDQDLLVWLVGYWLREFDWSARQTELNAFAQFRASVDGLGLHFVHQRGGEAVPLLVLHGWPSTFAQMTRLVPLLTHSPDGDPAGLVFDVVVPSLPGFGFSDRPTTPGWNLDAMARVLHRLMVEVLGYRRYAVRGSDYGLSIALRLGALYPRQVIGVHVGGTHLRVDRVPDDLSAGEERFVAASRRWYAEEGGYLDIQSTKPQTLGYALSDSPVGLLGWIVEKYRTWCARPQDLLSVFSADDLLTVATICWATGTITSSMRLYQEERLHPVPTDPVRVPLAINQPAVEEYLTPPEWWRRFQPVSRHTSLVGASHFPEWEAPAGLARDLREFLQPLL